MVRTKNPIVMTPNRLSAYNVPAGADLITVQNGTGLGYALANPEKYIPESDVLSRHDVKYYYQWVALEDVEI